MKNKVIDSTSGRISLHLGSNAEQLVEAQPDKLSITEYEELFSEYLYKGQFGDFVSALTEALDFYPENTLLLLFKAYMECYRGNYKQGREIVEMCYIRQPYDPDVKFARAVLLDNLGSHRDAEPLYEACIKSHPNAASVYEAIVRINVEHGELELACKHCMLAMVACPENRNFPIDFCNMMINLNKRGLARTFLEQVAEAHGNPESLWCALAKLYRLDNNISAAAVAAEKAVACAPTYCEAQAERLRCYAAADNYEILTQLVNESLNAVADSDKAYIYTTVSELYTKMGKYEEAYAPSAMAIQLDENDERAMVIYLRALMMNHGIDSAASKLRQYLQIYPYSSSLHHTQAQLYTVQKKFNEAFTEYEQALSLDRDDLMVWLDYATAFMFNGQYERAVEVLHQGLFMRSGTLVPYLYSKLAACYFYLHDRENLYNAITKTLDMAPHLKIVLYSDCPEMKNDKAIVELIESYE